ncbi:hypothetical protein C8F04DRAFT_1185694 [Mycena alexandri]|uniref:Uncharacterized protein n=1 Tax=Mycena alexandri TaxID=1745969 RepID=A0AAD6SQB4_9AGAR|nr:hypothetical protein C8F04DRAFT_1185694 [Mycena alexandri]
MAIAGFKIFHGYGQDFHSGGALGPGRNPPDSYYIDPNYKEVLDRRTDSKARGHDQSGEDLRNVYRQFRPECRDGLTQRRRHDSCVGTSREVKRLGLDVLGIRWSSVCWRVLTAGGGGLYLAFAEKMVLLESSAGVPGEMVHYRAPRNQQRERIDDGGRDVGSLRRGFHGSGLPKLQRQESARQDADMGQAERNTDLEEGRKEGVNFIAIGRIHVSCKGKRQLGLKSTACVALNYKTRQEQRSTRGPGAGAGRRQKPRQEQLVVRLGPGAGAGCLWSDLALVPALVVFTRPPFEFMISNGPDRVGDQVGPQAAPDPDEVPTYQVGPRGAPDEVSEARTESDHKLLLTRFLSRSRTKPDHKLLLTSQFKSEVAGAVDNEIWGATGPLRRRLRRLRGQTDMERASAQRLWIEAEINNAVSVSFGHSNRGADLHHYDLAPPALLGFNFRANTERARHSRRRFYPRAVQELLSAPADSSTRKVPHLQLGARMESSHISFSGAADPEGLVPVNSYRLEFRSAHISMVLKSLSHTHHRPVPDLQDLVGPPSNCKIDRNYAYTKISED